MSFWALGGLINGFTSSIFGFFVYLKNRESPVNRSWAIFSCTVAYWGYSYFLWQISTDKISALFWCRSLMAGAIFIPVTFFHFLLIWIKLYQEKKRILFVCYYISLIAFVLNFTPFFIKDLTPILWFKYWPQAGIAYLPFLIFWAWLVSYCCYVMFQSLRASSPIKRNQIKYVLVAAIIGFSGGFTNYPLWYGIKIPPYGNILVSVYVGIMAYAIIRYRLMDIRVAITRAGIFAFVYTLVLGIPFFLGYKYRFWMLSTYLVVVLASGGPFIYTIIRRRAESRLRKEEFLAHQALNNLAQNMMRFTNLELLLKLIVHHVVKIMKVYSASIYLKEEGSKYYHLRAAWGINNNSPEQNEFSENALLIKDILLRNVPTILDELKFNQDSNISSDIGKLESEIRKSKAAVIVPAFKGDILFGFLMLGARRDNRIFTQEDLSLLLLLANQSVFAIENAQLVEKEKTFLSEKSRRDALADMAPGVAHQFNNRLAAIIVAADARMALNELEDLSKLNPEKLTQLIKESQTTLNTIEKEALRGKDIASAILKKGRAKLTYIKTDLSPIIQSAIELLKVSRTRASLEGTHEPEIILKAEENLPKLVLSESLIQDVFYNLIDNARDAIIIKTKYIRENKITSETTPYKGKIVISVQKKNNNVLVSLTDNGIGIKKENIKRLFVPYFTTKATAYKGTGMGLWVIRSFIEDHKGKISVESEYTKGTTFTIIFPTQRDNDEQETANH